MQYRYHVPRLSEEYKRKFEADLRKKLLEALKAIEEATRDP